MITAICMCGTFLSLECHIFETTYPPPPSLPPEQRVLCNRNRLKAENISPLSGQCVVAGVDVLVGDGGVVCVVGKHAENLIAATRFPKCRQISI